MRRSMKSSSDVTGVSGLSRPPQSTAHLLDVFLLNVKIMLPEN